MPATTRKLYIKQVRTETVTIIESLFRITLNRVNLNHTLQTEQLGFFVKERS